MKITEDDFKMFEAWKESEDYLIQSWFKKEFDEIAKWFDNAQLSGFTMNGFYWSSNDNYLIYTGVVEFSEDTADYKLDFVIDFESVSEGQPSEFNVIMSGYTATEDSTKLGKLQKKVENNNFTLDYLINMIAEFKQTYPNE